MNRTSSVYIIVPASVAAELKAQLDASAAAMKAEFDGLRASLFGLADVVAHNGPGENFIIPLPHANAENHAQRVRENGIVAANVVQLHPPARRPRTGGSIAAAPATAPNPMQLPPFSDETLAVQFAQIHAMQLRYCAAWGQWFVWTGCLWERDDTLQAMDLVRKFCREIAADPGSGKNAKSIASAKTVSAVDRLARADRALAATIGQWDLDPMLLNTPAGVVDLRSGAVGLHDPKLHMTKITAAAPEGGCPTWLAFLDRITAGDRDLQAYLQRVLGYTLTGDTSEQALFFGYGTGANGKSVLLDTVAGILGDYHRSAPIETFAESIGERHPTELARLQGARLVTAVETEEGRRWAEARIKSLTGGDTITARFMRQDFFEYQPQFKLLIAGNHKPGLRTVDEAIRRRFNLIPFAVTIPEGERDPMLKEKLTAEWGGILSWMIEGCLDWQRVRLSPSETVRKATDTYLESEDAIGAWLEECCEIKAGAWDLSQRLFASWKGHAERAGEKAGTQKSFSQTLEARGFHPKRTSHARGFEGLRLRDIEGGYYA